MAGTIAEQMVAEVDRQQLAAEAAAMQVCGTLSQTDQAQGLLHDDH